MEYAKSRSQVYNLARSLERKGRITAIRSGLFGLNDLETGKPLASPAQIACSIHSDSVICRDSAVRYYLGESIDTYWVASDKRTSSFTFQGVSYINVMRDDKMGVIRTDEGLMVTDPEWTVLDAFLRINDDSDLRRVLDLLSVLEKIETDKLMKYLSDIGNKFLYQKTGFILEHFSDRLSSLKTDQQEQISAICEQNIGRSKRYLFKPPLESGDYIKKWQIIVPLNEVDLFR